MCAMDNLDHITEAKASQLLDFNEKLDISLLDNVITIMYQYTGAKQKMAEKILSNLKEHPDAWTRVDCILEFSKSQNTKFYALQILENFIKTRWKILSRDQCDGIKKYVVGLIIQISSKSESLNSEKILKHEWPQNWPTFISDIVGASNTNEYLCQNNMIILRLLSEEVFDFSSGALTQTKTRHLKDSMCKEFGIIFQLCQLIMENSQSAELVSSTLETLLRFINWIPYGYIFETNLIPILIDKFLHLPLFRNITIKCLTEIAGTSVPDFEDGCVQLLRATTKKINSILPPTVDIKTEYEKGSGEDQDFISNLAQFFCTFLKTYYDLIMSPKLSDVFDEVYCYLLLISEVNEREIFKICLEYWNFLLSNLYDAKARQSLDERFTPILSKLRKIMISRMARPEEVLVVENEHKEIVREFMKDTDSLNLYKNMKEALVYLTNLDQEDTRKIMLDKLAHQVDESEWSWNNLNTLCWAIGSISGTMPDDDERNFVVIVIRELLKLCENKRGKDNKAVIASNIMYVVGQYQRFLRAHWRFLKTVVIKLFEFMHETHEGIQDMACDTFIKIANKCRRQLATVQSGETVPFIEEILSDLPKIITDLQIGQLNTFYEAIGLIISIQTDSGVQRKQIESLFAYPNSIWDTLLVQASNDVNSLFNCDVQRQLQHLLKTNQACCKSLGHPFLVQLSRLYLDMLNIYKILSENINNAIKENGEEVVKQPVLKSMRLTKKAILNLISCWIKLTNQKQMVADTFVSVLLDGVAADYESNHPLAREPEVLSTMATLVESLESSILPHLPRILDTVFQSTLEMINKDLEEFPEHRTYFFELLQAVNEKCFGALLVLTADKFKFILDSVIWAIKHTMRQISETGLKILSKMLSNMINAPLDKHQMFFKNFFMDIMQHMFAVLTDRSQTGNLAQQCSVLAFMFDITENGLIKVYLDPASQIPLGNQTTSPIEENMNYINETLSQLLINAFPHLQLPQIKIFITGLFSFDQKFTEFKEHVRDFLVQIRQVTGEDLSDLYLDERNEEIQKAQMEKMQRQRIVPGMVNPNEIDMLD